MEMIQSQGSQLKNPILNTPTSASLKLRINFRILSRDSISKPQKKAAMTWNSSKEWTSSAIKSIKKCSKKERNNQLKMRSLSTVNKKQQQQIGRRVIIGEEEGKIIRIMSMMKRRKSCRSRWERVRFWWQIMGESRRRI